MSRIPTFQPGINVPSGRLNVSSNLGGVPRSSTAALAAVGSGLGRVGGTLLEVERRRLRIDSTRSLIRNDIDGENAISLARELADKADPIEAQDIFDRELSSFRSRLESITNNDIRKDSLLAFERRSQRAAILVRHSAALRGSRLGRDSIDAFEEEQKKRLLTGTTSLEEAVEEFTRRIMPMVGISFSDREAAVRIQMFSADAMRSEYDRLFLQDAGEAAALMESEAAIGLIPEKERLQRIAVADDVLDEQHAQVAESRVRMWRTDIRNLLSEEFVDPDEFVKDVDGMVGEMEGLPGFMVKGLFVRDRVATPNDLRLILLEDELRLAATSGNRAAFDAIVKALPNTSVAQQAIVKGKAILNGVRRAAELAEEFQIKRGRILGAAQTLMLNADTVHGAPMIDDVELTLSDGSTKTITRKEIIDEVIEQTIPQLGRESPTPDAALANQVEFLSRNGVTFPPFERVFSAGHFAVANDFGAIVKTGGLPANLDTAYSLYKRMGAMNPRLRDAHIKDSTAKRFYEAAFLAEKFVTPGDATAALLLTTKAFSGRAAFSDPLANSITRNTFEQAVKSVSKQGFFFFKRKARNTSEIGAKIEQLARFYIQTIGLGAKDAVDEAAERIKESHTIINGWAIDTGNAQVPPNIAVISELIIKSYVEEFGEEEGVDEEDLALIPGETEATWILFNQQVLMPVESWRDNGIFTNADLRRIAEGETQSIREGIIHEQIPNIGSVDPSQGILLPRLGPLRMDSQGEDRLRGPGRRALLLEGKGGGFPTFDLAPDLEVVASGSPG